MTRNRNAQGSARKVESGAGRGWTQVHPWATWAAPFEQLVGTVGDSRVPRSFVGTLRLASRLDHDTLTYSLADIEAAVVEDDDTERMARLLGRLPEDPVLCAQLLAPSRFPPAFGVRRIPVPEARAAVAGAIGELDRDGGALLVEKPVPAGGLCWEVVAATILRRSRTLAGDDFADPGAAFSGVRPASEAHRAVTVVRGDLPLPVVFAAKSAGEAGRFADRLTGVEGGSRPNASSGAWVLTPDDGNGFKKVSLSEHLAQLVGSAQDFVADPEDLRQAWEEAREEFQRRDAEYLRVVGLLRAAERDLLCGPELREQVDRARAAQEAAENLYGQRAVAEAAASERLGHLDEEVYEAHRQVDEVRQERPSLLVRLLRESREREWITRRRRSEKKLQQRLEAAEAGAAALQEARTQLESAREGVSTTVRATRHARRTLQARKRRLEEWNDRLGSCLPDSRLYEESRNYRMETKEESLPTPVPGEATWQYPELGRAARALLGAALALHRCAAWYAIQTVDRPDPSKGTGLVHHPGSLLGHLDDVLSGRTPPPSGTPRAEPETSRGRPGRRRRARSLQAEHPETLAARLLAALGLVAPVLCIAVDSDDTFRLFGALGPEDLGWLLLDGRGHEDPAAFFGLAYRARRVMILPGKLDGAAPGAAPGTDKAPDPDPVDPVALLEPLKFPPVAEPSEALYESLTKDAPTGAAGHPS